MMDPTLKSDITKLWSDTEETRRELETLKKDRSKWARNREQNDLTDFLKDLKRLESDLVMVLADWTLQNCRAKNESQTDQVFDSFHHSLAKLNILFSDLKKVRTELNKAYIHSISLKELEIDWDRYCKEVERISGYLSDRILFEAEEQTSQSDGSKNERFSTIH